MTLPVSQPNQFQVTHPNLVALVRCLRAALEHCPKETAELLHDGAMQHVRALNDALPKDAEPTP